MRRRYELRRGDKNRRYMSRDEVNPLFLSN